MTTLNAYDNQIYAYGKGPSKTTVSAPQRWRNHHNTDHNDWFSHRHLCRRITTGSCGELPQWLTMRFRRKHDAVHGVCLHAAARATQRNRCPSDISVIDANGNYRTIGSTTTNGLGDYSFTWKPDIQGNYTVYATFAGTQSYYGSTASTGFYASSPAATPAPTATPLSGLPHKPHLNT